MKEDYNKYKKGRKKVKKKFHKSWNSKILFVKNFLIIMITLNK